MKMNLPVSKFVVVCVFAVAISLVIGVAVFLSSKPSPSITVTDGLLSYVDSLERLQLNFTVEEAQGEWLVKNFTLYHNATLSGNNHNDLTWVNVTWHRLWFVHIATWEGDYLTTGRNITINFNYTGDLLLAEETILAELIFWQPSTDTILTGYSLCTVQLFTKIEVGEDLESWEGVN